MNSKDRDLVYTIPHEALNGELMTLPEAVGWVIFRDLAMARACEGHTPIAMASMWAIAKSGLDYGPPVMSAKDAELKLMEALKRGALAASAIKNSGRRAPVTAGEWKPMHLRTESNEWRADGDGGDIVFRDILVSVDGMLKAFEDIATSTADNQAMIEVAPGGEPPVGGKGFSIEKPAPLPLAPGKRGRKVAYDWPAFYAEARRFRAAAGDQTTQAAIEEHMAEWCALTWGEKKVPGERTIRDHVRMGSAKPGR